MKRFLIISSFQLVLLSFATAQTNSILAGNEMSAEDEIKVVLYRPYDQLRRQYTVRISEFGTLKFKRQEELVFSPTSNSLSLSISAIGHKNSNHAFALEKGKTYFFRIQDRNNYIGFRAFIEVIEVNENTYRKDLSMKKM